MGAVIGIEIDWDMQNAGSSTLLVFEVFNISFIIIFTVELALRMANERCSFFARTSKKIGWNVFDTLLVVSALGELILSKVLASSPDMSVMRVFRTMRLVRGFRIIRVLSFFKDLRVMLAGIVYSLHSLVWAVLLLACMMYLFAVCVLQFAADEASLKSKNQGVLSESEFLELQDFYGSLGRTFYTLYLSICGGVDWGDAAAPLLALNPLLGMLYSFYIAFAVLCVLNIITGVFVENANRLTAQDEEMVLMEQMEVRRQWFEEVKDLFNAADLDGSGELDVTEFSDKMQDVRMQAWFRKIGVQVEAYSAQGLFQLLDFDGDGKLDLDEFAIALQSVHGAARSIDVAKINRDTRLLRREVAELTDMCFAFFKGIPSLFSIDDGPAVVPAESHVGPAVSRVSARYSNINMR